MKASEHKRKEIDLGYDIEKAKRDRNRAILWITLCGLMFLVFLSLFLGGVLLGSFAMLKAGYAAGMWIPGVIGGAFFFGCTFSLWHDNQWEFEKVHIAERDLAKHMAIEIEYNVA